MPGIRWPRIHTRTRLFKSSGHDNEVSHCFVHMKRATVHIIVNSICCAKIKGDKGVDFDDKPVKDDVADSPVKSQTSSSDSS